MSRDYRIHQIKLKLDEEKALIPEKIRRKLEMPDLDITRWQIVRESIDARHKPDIRRVYSVDFTCTKELKKKALGRVQNISRQRYAPPPVRQSKKDRPLVIGAGPCGLFAALILAEAGLRPIVLERGKPVADRVQDVEAFRAGGTLDPESNVPFGEGGAGTFSDGKLNTGIRDIRVRKVLETLVEAGADPAILYRSKPHIGTDRLRDVIPRIRQRILGAGGEFRFSTRLVDLQLQDGAGGDPVLTGIRIAVRDGAGRESQETLAASRMILAIGHSARDTFSMLRGRGLAMEKKPFSMGVRIVHPQAVIDRAQYGDPSLARMLGAAEYKLVHHGEDGRSVYTFCMCPGGEVICAASAPGQVVTNGMSNAVRDGAYANSGLLAEVRPEDIPGDDPLAGVEYQRKYEEMAFRAGGGDYSLPRTRWEDFPSSKVAACLPDYVAAAIACAMPHLGRKLRGFDDPDALMIGVETRSSSPVRLLRADTGMGNIGGMYPAGEGAGYAGGIVSAAVDGMRAAEALIAG